MIKKEPTTTICLILPRKYVRMIDEGAGKECVTRTAIIKSIIKDWCLKQGRLK
jgi:hypothetical protein